MNTKVSLLISSCDSYSDMWIPFFSLLKKYWVNLDYPVYLATQTKSFIFDGLDIKCPLKTISCDSFSWSERLLKALEQIDTEYIILLLDDFWIQKHINISIIDKCISYMISDPRIGFICLKYQNHDFNSECEYPELVKREKKAPYRISTQGGLWRRKYLMKILRKHESAWAFETRATWRSRFYSERVYEVKSEEYSAFTYPWCGVVRGGKYIQEYLNEYQDETLEINTEREVVKDLSEIVCTPLNRRSFIYCWNMVKSVLPKWY